MRNPVASRRNQEDGASFTIEFLIYVPLAIMFIGFLLNSAFHWSTALYMQGVVNEGATYTANAGGDVILPYVPNGGTDLTPSQYISVQAIKSVFVRELSGVSCQMISGRSEANGVSRCEATYRTLVFPTDPVTARSFGSPITIVSEDVAQTAYNPNVT